LQRTARFNGWVNPSAWRFGFVGLLALVTVAGLRAQDADKSGKPGECVDVRSEASFASVGYDHIVTLKSACKKRVSCSVKTDVNPDPASVDLDPGEEKSVVTWRGSPARVFTPIVKCK
jgi:hypothetical protein